jgi:hypothetical protein
MATTSVNLETRHCVHCERKFKVMEGSPTLHCSSMCKEYGTRGHSVRQRPSSENERPKTVVSVSTTPPTQKKSIIDAGPIVPLNPWPSVKKKNSERELNIKETRGDTMQNELNGHAETKRGSSQHNAAPTTEKEPNALQPYTKAEIVETQPESSDEHSKSILVDSSAILNLSKRSASRLMSLMEATVTDEDLNVDRSMSGQGALSLQRVQVAIQAANAITGIVQANVNLLKAIKDGRDQTK